MTDIERVVASIAAYDAGFPRRIRGASAEKIDKLEAAAGQQLRSVYRHFLLAMGENMDWLRPKRARFGIDDMLAYYGTEKWRPPVGYFKFALAEDDPFFDLYLEALDAGQPRVIQMPRGPLPNFEATRRSLRKAVAGSLPEFLGTAGIRRMRLDKLPNFLRIAGNDGRNALLEKVPPALAPFRLAPLWFSNDWVQAFDTHDAAVIATQFPGGVLAIDIATSAAERLDDLVQALQSRFGLTHKFPRAS